MRRRRFMQGVFTAGVAAGVNPAGVSTIALADPSVASGTEKKKPRIMFYHDGRHPLIYMYEPPIQKEQFEAAVDELVGTPVEALMFCLGDGRTVLHDTKVGELWGHSVKKWPHLIFRRAHQNAKKLIEEGNDPLRVVCDRAHAKGMLLYPTLLVQQGTGIRGQDTRSSDFRFDNRQLEIGARGGVDPKFPGVTCLDFKLPEVREERFRLIEETLLRYPVDGFELQMNYQPYYFRPDEVEAGRTVMTEWIRRVYKAVKASGNDRELAIRIPISLGQCLAAGLNVKEWIDQGVVDIVIGETAHHGVDHTADFRPLVAAAKGSKCRIHAAIQSTVDSDRMGESTTAMTRAVACNYWAQGIDGLYVDQWFSNWPYQGPFYERLRELPHPEVMSPKDKYYCIPTVSCRYPERLPFMQLPVDLKLNEPVRIKLPISDDLPRWHKVGRVHEMLLRLRVMNTTELDSLEFSLNGRPLPDGLLRKINEMFRMSAPRCRTDSGYWFIYHLDSPNWLRNGENLIEVNLRKRDPEVTPQILLRDVELEIKYLMGRNFHRGQDIELGPYDRSME